MSWCGGRVDCEIYRQKKYCRRGDHAEEGEVCNCRHAKYTCEVEDCSLIKMCQNPDSKLALARREAQ